MISTKTMLGIVGGAVALSAALTLLHDAKRQPQAVARLPLAALAFRQEKHLASGTNFPAPITHAMVEARYKRAKELVRNGDADEALKELLWCYDEGMVSVSSYLGARFSYLLDEMVKLGERHPAALAALRERRDAARQKILAGATEHSALAITTDAGGFLAFVSINRVLNEEQATLELYDRLPAGDSRRQPLGRAAHRLFIARQRYADALFSRPYSSMNAMLDHNNPADPVFATASDPERLRKIRHEYLIESAPEDVEALAGAGELSQARQLARKLLSYEDSSEVRAALQQHLTRAGHPDLLAPAPGAK